MYCYWSCRNIYAENTVLRNADVINSNLSRFGPNNVCTAPCIETIRLLCFAPRIARFPLPSLRSEKICVCFYVRACALPVPDYRTSNKESIWFRLLVWEFVLVVFLPLRKNSLRRVMPVRPSRTSVFAVCGNEFRWSIMRILMQISK